MRKRRFIDFTKEELKIMQESLDSNKLKNEIEEEIKIREYNQKRYEEWIQKQPKAYVC